MVSGMPAGLAVVTETAGAGVGDGGSSLVAGGASSGGGDAGFVA